MKIINVPIKIPDELVAQGAVELYAQSKGWTQTLERDHLDENGNVDGRETIDNQQSAEDFCIEYVQNLVKEDYQSLIGMQAQKQVIENINKILDNN